MKDTNEWLKKLPNLTNLSLLPGDSSGGSGVPTCQHQIARASTPHC